MSLRAEHPRAPPRLCNAYGPALPKLCTYLKWPESIARKECRKKLAARTQEPLESCVYSEPVPDTPILILLRMRIRTKCSPDRGGRR